MDNKTYWIVQITGAGLMIVSYFIKELTFFIPVMFLMVGVGIVHQIQELRKELSEKKGKEKK